MILSGSVVEIVIKERIIENLTKLMSPHKEKIEQQVAPKDRKDV